MKLLKARHALVLALLGLAVQAGAVPAAVPALYQRDDFEDQLDALVTEGFEHPARALERLEPMLSTSTPPERRRQLLQAIGSVEAQTGRAVPAGRRAEELLALARDDSSGRALAASNLVRALLAENTGQTDVAAALAQSALPALQAGCPGAAAPEGRCDYRSAWRALQVMERRAMSLGLRVTEAAHAQAALQLAEWAGDNARQAINLGTLALLAQRRGETDNAQRLVQRARQLVMHGDDPTQQSRLSDIEARLASGQGEHRRALRHLEQARALAALAGAPRLEARLLSNLSDMYMRLDRPADALRAAERALPVVHSHNDLRAERLLINNAGIAKIGLGRVAEGKQDLTRLLAMWQASGDSGRQAETLLEFGEALAAAGDARSAVELFHRERHLSAELMRQNRAIALKELQTRNDAEARQRDIDLLARDNALKTEALAIRDLRQRMWWALAALMLLATAVVALLYRRVRESNRRLAASHAQLRAASERDPLTNLANRRHFHAVMASLAAEGGFEGALLLVDIDHFKRANDLHGHAGGDQVLVEVARRLEQAVRAGDLVVRWGGEEFLILAPRAAPDQAAQMAARVLRSLGQTPIAIGPQQSLRATASIGYGRFPLPPYNAVVPWEQAIKLADLALYLAKHQGRNQAVGITSTTAATAEALREIEADFERARHDGRITLLQTPGPQGADVLRVA
jgi:diguanylate cyclase (GGDEF)-like protein